MFKHILVPTDGSKLSLKALDLAAGIASATHAKVSVLYVSPSYPTMIGGDGYMITPSSVKDWDVSIAEVAAGVREQVEKRAGAKSVAVQFLTVSQSGRPSCHVHVVSPDENAKARNPRNTHDGYIKTKQWAASEYRCHFNKCPDCGN